MNKFMIPVQAVNQRNTDPTIDIRKTIILLLSYWYWFVLFGFLGLGAAYLYTHLTKQKYSVNSAILIPQKPYELDMKKLFNLENESDYTDIYNQAEILKSSFTIKKALIALGWRTNWYKNETFYWKGLYPKAPFDIREPDDFKNPAGIKLFIKVIDHSCYMISAKGVIVNNETALDINFESKGQFGQPFKNKYFNFILSKNHSYSDSIGKKFYFIFNDLNQSTLAYQKRLDVTLKDDYSDIVLCNITGSESEKDADFLNELIRVYIVQEMNFKNEAQRRSLGFINAQLAEISDSLTFSSNQYTNFRSSNEIIDLGTEAKLVLNNLKEIETEQAKSQVQLDYYTDLLYYLEKSDHLSQLVSPSVVGIADPSLNSLVARLGELFNSRQILSFTAKADNPTLLLLDREILQTRNRLIENLKNLVFNATKSINSLKRRQSSISHQLIKLPVKEQQLINIERKYNLTNEIYTFLLEKQAETNISLASTTSDIQIIEPAGPGTTNSKGLNSKMILFLGLILGLIFPAGIIWLINLFDPRIVNQEDIEINTQLPIIGNIVHNSETTELTVINYPNSMIAESFRDLRTNLGFLISNPQPKVISIHSTNPQEGKSYTSINLASILAMNEDKVLLIGADMRKPKLHKIFNFDNKHGLSTYLAGDDEMNQVIIQTSIKNLSIIPSGPNPPNPSEILGRSAMKGLIEKAREDFDYIILDNAPIAVVTDGLIVSRLSDFNIFILRFGKSHKHQLEIINQFANTKKVAAIGLIVNDIKTNLFGNNYYKYYQLEAFKKSYHRNEENNKRQFKKKISI